MGSKQNGIRFVIKIVAVYILWKLFHYYVHQPGSLFFEGWKVLVDRMNVFYAHGSEAVLQMLGEKTEVVQNAIQNLNTGRVVWVEEHCLAIPAMLIFASAILFYTGSRQNKLWYIPAGLVAIFIINLFRIISVYYLFNYSSELFFEINHSYVYVAITYSLIFIMIWWWMKKLSIVAKQ